MRWKQFEIAGLPSSTPSDYTTTILTRSRPPMSELDVAKERIAYLKFWLGAMVVTDISMGGWLITSAAVASVFEISAAVVAVVALTLGSYNVHRQINSHIEALRDL